MTQANEELTGTIQNPAELIEMPPPATDLDNGFEPYIFDIQSPAISRVDGYARDLSPIGGGFR